MEQPFSIDRIVELLTLCQSLQSEKDGIARPAIGKIDPTKKLDQFARDILTSVTYVLNLNRLMPMSDDLVALAKLLHQQGKITVDGGGDYARVALDYLLTSNGLSKAGT